LDQNEKRHIFADNMQQAGFEKIRVSDPDSIGPVDPGGQK
jgi:hypothetical protein